MTSGQAITVLEAIPTAGGQFISEVFSFFFTETFGVCRRPHGLGARGWIITLGVVNFAGNFRACGFINHFNRAIGWPRRAGVGRLVGDGRVKLSGFSCWLIGNRLGRRRGRAFGGRTFGGGRGGGVFIRKSRRRYQNYRDT